LDYGNGPWAVSKIKQRKREKREGEVPNLITWREKTHTKNLEPKSGLATLRKCELLRILPLLVRSGNGSGSGSGKK
jgi:hypothetical protein